MPATTALLEPAGDDWLGTREAATRLGITPRTLYRLIDGGALPAYRFGRVIRLRAGDIDDHIDASRILPGTISHLHDFPGENPAAASEKTAEESEHRHE